MAIAAQDPKKIKFLTLHCAATPEGRDLKAADIVKIGEQRFGQPSYHFVIELDGNAARTLRDDQRGAHVGGANTGNIGICYVGGMDKANKNAKDTRTDAQKTSMRTLIRTYQERFPGIEVKGHKDWPGVKKACPCFEVRKWVAEGMPI